MDYATEQKLKSAISQNQAQTPYPPTGGGDASQCGELRGLGRAVDDPCRQTLNERIASQLRRAQRESSNLSALGELQYLLEKNPETARILDLLEAVRNY